MLFGSKPTVYFQFFERSVRYLVAKQGSQNVLDKGEVVFDTPIIEDRKIANVAAVQSRLDALVKEKKWKGSKASVALSNSFVVIRRETIPGQLNETEIEEYIDLHINDTIRLPIDSPIFDFQLIRKTDVETEEDTDLDQDVLIVAYPEEIVSEIKKLLGAIKLKPDVADIASLSLYRIAEKQGLLKNPHNEYNLVMQWKPFNVSMTVFYDERPTFNRDSHFGNIENSWNLENDGSWRWLESDEDYNEMVTEHLDSIARFIDFYRYSVLDGEEQISNIILSGDFPNIEILKTMLEERFNISVKLPQLPDGFEQRYAVLYGLAIKEKGGKK